jgi:hypothetical protein
MSVPNAPACARISIASPTRLIEAMPATGLRCGTDRNAIPAESLDPDIPQLDRARSVHLHEPEAAELLSIDRKSDALKAASAVDHAHHVTILHSCRSGVIR